MIRRPPRSTQSRSSAASDVYKRQPGQLHPRLRRLGDVAGSGEHALQLSGLVAMDGRVVLDVHQRAGDVAEHERIVADETLFEDPLVPRPRLVGLGEVVREVGADQTVTRNAGGLLGGLVDVGDLAFRADRDQRVEIHLDEAAGVERGGPHLVLSALVLGDVQVDAEGTRESCVGVLDHLPKPAYPAQLTVRADDAELHPCGFADLGQLRGLLLHPGQVVGMDAVSYTHLTLPTIYSV